MTEPTQTVFGIEIAETCLTAGEAGDRLRASEPAVAHFDGDRIVTGREAFTCESLGPTWNDFWMDLSRDPLLDSGTDRTLTRSILAYHHLAQAAAALDAKKESVSCALAVAPAILSDEERTGLLLSMCETLGLRLRGLVPLPLALAISRPGALPRDGRIDVLDLDAGQWTVYSLHVQEAILRAGTATSTRDGRLDLVRAHYFDALAGRFLAETAFDVHHSAEAEGLFRLAVEHFLALPPAEGESTVGLATRRERSITVSRAAARELAGDLPMRVVRALGLDQTRQDAPLLASHRVSRLPGLAEALIELRHRQVTLLPLEAAVHGVARAARDWPVAETVAGTPEFGFLSIPEPAVEPPLKTQPFPPAPKSPSHAVWRGHIYRLDDPRLPFALPLAAGQITQTEGVRVNGDAPNAFQPVRPGDQLDLQGERFLLARQAPD